MAPSTPPASTYISRLLGRPVRAADQSLRGTLVDLLVPTDTGDPSVGAIVIRSGHGEISTHAAEGAQLMADGELMLAAGAQPMESANLLSLREHVLDRQIIDVNGIRVVRVNDIQVAPTNGGGLMVVGIDVSTAGLLRRLGVADALGAIGVRPAPHVIDWHDVEPITSESEGIQLRVSRSDLARLHPADIGHLLSQLDHQHGGALLAQLPHDTAAEALGEVHEALQARLLRSLDAEHAAVILEQMDPDDAADVLADLSPEHAEDLLLRMSAEAAQDVRELLDYGDDSAGGLMTKQFVTVPWTLTAEETIARVRELGSKLTDVRDVYVVDDEQRLRGVLSLLELIVASPTAPVQEVMRANLVVAHPDDTAAVVARLIARYNLLALPVVGDGDRMLGIVTVDDAMDVVLPARWKTRLPRVFHHG